MKTKVFAFVGFLLSLCLITYGKEETKTDLSQADTLRVSCTQEMFDLTSKWVNEFEGLNPDIPIIVTPVPENSMTKTLKGGSDLGIINQANSIALNDQALWSVVIGRDILVPVMNASNPFLNEILQQGISSNDFAQIIRNPEMRKWGTLLNNDQNAPVHYYLVNDASISSGLLKFLNISATNLNDVEVKSEKELITLVQNDPYAIGFCKLTSIVEPNSQNLVSDIQLVPIDNNGNGKIDFIENIYGNVADFQRGVWIGKYPKSLYQNIYSIASGNPTGTIELAFLTWVITDGQQLMKQSGYSELVFNERQSKIDKFMNVLKQEAPGSQIANIDYVFPSTTEALILIFIVLGAAAFILMIRSQNRKVVQSSEPISGSPLLFSADSVTAPKGLFYDKSHTWVFMNEEGRVKVGIDDFLQHLTGPITRIKMKNAGEKIKKGDPILSIVQNGKHLTVYAPISGTIKEQNEQLNSNSLIINNSPYKDGWVYVIDPVNWINEIRFLIMEKKYKEWIKGEFSRFKDFLSLALKPEMPNYAYSTLQEGGEIKNGILEELGPEIWEDFQTHFIDIPQ
ncbi:MAG: hypothetical protein K9H64_09170 [Bacteroidales bacterium]|nr:hypothetical protein [Bacteroidales bacterium]MCF8456036.1 hypothetical protein [Bacteroidales bacterium]